MTVPDHAGTGTLERTTRIYEYVCVHCLLGGEQADDISFQRGRVRVDERQCSSETSAGPVSDHVHVSCQQI